MDYETGFVMQKMVDWSLLNDGMTIPTAACSLFKVWDESILTHGKSKDIKMLIDGEFYEAKLKNQNFEQSNWAGHKDVIQIRYSRQSPLAVKLRSIFKRVTTICLLRSNCWVRANGRFFYLIIFMSISDYILPLRTMCFAWSVALMQISSIWLTR